MTNRIAPRRFLSLFGWLLTGFLGAAAIAILATSHGEPINALWMVIASVCVFAIAYRFHSAWLMAKVLTLDELRATPARIHEDGKDYVPTNKWVVFGHHFAAIAGPGPLVGPVLAAQFGYLPGMLWILVGATLGGAVHDCIILFCSIRRRGKSLGQMVREEIGPFAGFITLVSVVAIMVILVAVLALVVVKALAESPWGLFTILASMPIAMIMGVAFRHGKMPIGLISAFGVAALLLSVFGGQFLKGSALEPLLTLDGRSLAWGIMLYGLVASILPVWLLLAPRDYLSTFMKIGTVALLAVAIVAIAPPMQMPAITKFIDGTGPVFAGLVQDLLGYVWKPLGHTDHTVGNWLASVLFVAAWGYFLYQGVVDPLGGINSLWPIFGVANQLLAVIALSLDATVLLKMGRARYVWVAFLPLAWLLAVTVTAGWMKIFSPVPRLGFLSAAADFSAKVVSGGPAEQIGVWRQQILSNQVNAVVTGTFLLLVIAIVGACGREWWKLLVARKIRPLHEEPYVLLPVG